MLLDASAYSRAQLVDIIEDLYESTKELRDMLSKEEEVVKKLKSMNAFHRKFARGSRLFIKEIMEVDSMLCKEEV